MQENPNAIPEGETPHAVTMLCFDEMVDTSKPGDRVTVTGIYKAIPMRVNPRLRTLKSVYKTHIDILHVMRDEKSKLFTVSDNSQEATDSQEVDDSLLPVSILQISSQAKSDLANWSEPSKLCDYKKGQRLQRYAGCWFFDRSNFEYSVTTLP